ncbi:MAG: hypothetical protein LBJ02_12295 [Bifidobacteriaceae bacterium]|jgi:hypothetical protein|nr:hypothetical protein [Bifidobacteriaceae bacterium]
MEWLTGTSKALAEAREGGTRKWIHPVIGAVMMIPLTYAIPVASFAALSGMPGLVDRTGVSHALTAQWLIGLTILLVMFIACGVIAYRLFGWPAWGALVFAVAAPLIIDTAWAVVFNALMA